MKLHKPMREFKKNEEAIRYCINSASLRFIHRDDMGAEGYGDYLNQVEDHHE